MGTNGEEELNMDMLECTEEIWSDIARYEDSDWRCFCGDETVAGNPVPEHSISEHNTVTYAADQVAEGENE